MNYETLKEEAKNITMDETKKEEMAQALRQTKTTRKRSPLIRALPAAAVLAVAVGAGLLLWKGSLNPPAVPRDETTALLNETTAASDDGTTAAFDNDTTAAIDVGATAPDWTLTEESSTEPVQTNQPVPQGSGTDPEETTMLPYSMTEEPAGNMWMLREGETAPQMDTLVRSYPGYEPLKNYAPPAGARTLSPALSAAIAQYGNEHVMYLLRITVFDHTSENRRTPDEQEAFYQREIDRMWNKDQSGVEFGIYRCTDESGNVTVEFVAHLHDPTCLDTLNWSPDCGYILELYDEQSTVK